jgi:hypothetical protein
MLFGSVAIAFTALPALILTAFPVMDANSLTFVLGLLDDMASLGRLGLAVALIGLMLWFVTRKMNSYDDVFIDLVPKNDCALELNLPPAALTIIAHIDGQLDALTTSAPADSMTTEDAFTIAEVRTRYLPATIDAYLAIQPFCRMQYAPRFIDQLRLVAEAVTDLTENPGCNRAVELEVNGRLLEHRFASRLQHVNWVTTTTLPTETI